MTKYLAVTDTALFALFVSWLLLRLENNHISIDICSEDHKIGSGSQTSPSLRSRLFIN